MKWGGKLDYEVDYEVSLGYSQLQRKVPYTMFLLDTASGNLFGGRILGRNWNKSLKSFPPCYSQSPLLTVYYPTPPPTRAKVGLKLVCNVNIVYRNLKPDNSQDYAKKPHRNCTFMNSASGWRLQDGGIDSGYASITFFLDNCMCSHHIKIRPVVMGSGSCCWERDNFTKRPSLLHC
jgi:hypothetical protein